MDYLTLIFHAVKKGKRPATNCFQEEELTNNAPSPLADAGVEQRGFVARVGSHEQQQVAVLDAGDASVQQVVGAQVSAAGREGESFAEETAGTLYASGSQSF